MYFVILLNYIILYCLLLLYYIITGGGGWGRDGPSGPAVSQQCNEWHGTARQLPPAGGTQHTCHRARGKYIVNKYNIIYDLHVILHYTL